MVLARDKPWSTGIAGGMHAARDFIPDRSV